MKTDEKISSFQLMLLLFSFVFPALVIPIPGIMAAFAKESAWLSSFPALLVGMINVWVLTTLARRYPGMTFMEYSVKILGTWLGKCLGAYMIYFWFSFISVVVNEHARFINIFLLPRTPTLVGILTMILLCAIAVYAGIEVIGRSNEFLAMLIILFMIPLILLAIGSSDAHNLKPVFASGIVPVLQGSYVLSSNINQIFLIAWLLPFHNRPNKAAKVAIVSVCGIVLLITVVDLLATMIFGPITGKLNYAFLSVIQYIGIPGSFERLEAIAVSIWVAGIFVKVSVLLYLLTLSISQLFGIRNYRDIVVPVAILSVIGGVWVFDSKATYLQFVSLSDPGWALFTQNVLPLALLAIDSIKRSFRTSAL